MGGVCFLSNLSSLYRYPPPTRKSSPWAALSIFHGYILKFVKKYGFIPADSMMEAARHLDGSNIGYADGHVKFQVKARLPLVLF